MSLRDLFAKIQILEKLTPHVKAGLHMVLNTKCYNTQDVTFFFIQAT